METVSFRLDGSLRGSLEDEARKVGTSLNGLASQIFQTHTSWGRYADGLRLLPVSKDLLRSVFQRLTREAIFDVAKEAAVSSGSEHILFLFQEISFNTVLRFLDLWRAKFDASQHRFDMRKHYYTIHHDVNKNYSLFLKEYVNSLIQDTIPRPVSFETVSPNAVTFSFEGGEKESIGASAVHLSYRVLQIPENAAAAVALATRTRRASTPSFVGQIRPGNQ